MLVEVVLHSQPPQPTITLDAQAVAFVIGVLLPFVTAFLTKLSASSRLKAIVNLVLVGITGVVAVLTTNAGRTLTVKEFILAIGTAFVAAIASHYGLWKPTGATPAVQAATPNFGLGPAKT